MFPLQLLVGFILFAMLFALIQIGALSIAFDKLGLSTGSAMLLLMSSLLGSGINLPLFTIDADPSSDVPQRRPPAWLNAGLPLREGKVLVAMNVGGGLLPIAFSAYLLARSALPVFTVVLAVVLQSAVCFAASRPIPRLGIGMPILLAPITAALIAVLLMPEQSAPLAYVCGTLGVLIGADLLRLRDVRSLGSPFASIGGAGTFDGVFITGIVAVLLA